MVIELLIADSINSISITIILIIIVKKIYLYEILQKQSFG